MGEVAVYGPVRQSREDFGEYIARCDKALARLKKESVDLPVGARGYIIYRQSGLNESQDQRFLVWAEGRYDRKSIVTTLRKLDQVVKEKSKAHYAAAEADDGPEGGQISQREGKVLWRLWRLQRLWPWKGLWRLFGWKRERKVETSPSRTSQTSYKMLAL